MINASVNKKQELENKGQIKANMGFSLQSNGAFQFQDKRPEAIVQQKVQQLANIQNTTTVVQPKANNTGLPNQLKSGIENLSGYSMDDVKVHYNSPKPAQLQAHAYAQGTDIHIASGQEKYLPHEAWHVVQQKQGRVKPTMQLKGTVNINDDAGLEKEADVMGARAIINQTISKNTLLEFPSNNHIKPVQRILTLDNGDFSEVNEIRKIGGNAEGAFLVSDGSGEVVLKIAEDIDSAVMAYNLAKDFGVTTPKGRYLSLDTPSGQKLIAIASKIAPDLATKLKKSSSVTLWSLVLGGTLEKYKYKNESDGETGEFIRDHTNFEQLGRMLVFDAAILNVDRFKMETMSATNAGNLMIAGAKPIAIDQDFANIDKTSDSTPSNQIESYSDMISEKMKPLFLNVNGLANQFCSKMEKEGFIMFKNQEKHIETGINMGIRVLKGLLAEENPRLEHLIEWAKTFKPKTDLNVTIIKDYWRSLL